MIQGVKVKQLTVHPDERRRLMEILRSDDKEFFTEAEAHRHFAIKLNRMTWDLLEKADRTQAEDELMLYSAIASCRHWLDAGTAVHHQRGEWLIARVYSVLGLGEGAVRHAQRCLKLTEEHAEAMADFDWAYAYEALARAHAITGSGREAQRFIRLAENAGDNISDKESKTIFMADLSSGEWVGLQ